MSTPWIAAFASLWLVVVVVAAIVLGLLRRIGDTLDQMQLSLSADELGARIGSTVPPFELTTADGTTMPSQAVFDDRALLLFLRAGCSSCRPLLASLRGVTDRIGDVPFALVLQHHREAEELSVPTSTRVFFEGNGSASAAFKKRATPQAYLIAGNRRIIDRQIVASFDDLVAMVNANGQEVQEHARDDPPGVAQEQGGLWRDGDPLAKADGVLPQEVT